MWPSTIPVDPGFLPCPLFLRYERRAVEGWGHRFFGEIYVTEPEPVMNDDVIFFGLEGKREFVQLSFFIGGEVCCVFFEGEVLGVTLQDASRCTRHI